MKIITKSKTITDKDEVKDFLNKYGIHAEFWQPESINDSSSNPLEKYKTQIKKLKEKFNYSSADVVVLNESTPNLDKVLHAFKKEHHHTDDEVRFGIEGEGIFGVNPGKDDPFEVLVESGDLLLVPAYTRHWFELTEKRSMKCIRVFKENPKWEAIYEEVAL